MDSVVEILQALSHLRRRTEQFEEIVDLLVESLNRPIIYHSGQQHSGFRFGNPDARHFCILKSIRMVSCLNACISLAEAGFHQDVFTIMRTFIEADAHIHFVAGDPSDKHLTDDQLKFVAEFFDDYQRNNSSDFKRPRLSQKKMNDAVGKVLDSYSRPRDPRHGGPTTASTLMSNVYLTSSNYVHARYPEIMDMYGGDPGKFHMSGMSNTSKDQESIEAIDTFCDNVPLTIRIVLVKFQIEHLLEGRPDLSAVIFD